MALSIIGIQGLGLTDPGADKEIFWDDSASALALQSAGKILQAQSASATGRTTITATSYTGAGVTDAITCRDASSKVLILINAEFGQDSNNASVTNTYAKFQLTRNHSGISETELAQAGYSLNFPEDSGMDLIFNNVCTFMFLDSPATTNALTYTLNGKVGTSGATLEVTSGGSGEFDKAITLLELGA